MQTTQSTSEVCDGVDDDCNGSVDDVAAGCTLFVTDPLNVSTLACSSPTTSQPTIAWNNAQFDKFRVFINTTPNFVATKGISSGGTLLRVSSWHVPKPAWVSLCKKATNGGVLYIKVEGTDVDVRAKDPLRKFFSPVVTTTVRK